MWVGEDLKEEIAGERGTWRASRSAQPNIFFASFLIVPPAEAYGLPSVTLVRSNACEDLPWDLPWDLLKRR